MQRQIAFNTHYGCQKYYSPRASMEEIRADFEENYNSSSTLDNVLHIRSKLACCGILDADLTVAAHRFAVYMKEHTDTRSTSTSSSATMRNMCWI